MRFLYNNLAVIYVAIVVSLLAWLFGGTRADLLLPVLPWLLAVMVEIVLVFPQRRDGESMYEARERVWHAMRKDPLVWVTLGLFALLTIPFFNTGLCPVCDAKLIAEGVNPNPLRFLPFCVDRTEHLNVCLWFFTAFTCVMAVRHCLIGRGKRMLMTMIVWNGFVLANLGFLQIALDAPGPLWTVPDGVKQMKGFFATWGYPNMAGDYFTALFGIAIALWRDARDKALRDRDDDDIGVITTGHRDFWRRNIYLLPAVFFFFAAINTLSRAAMILVTLLAVLNFGHAFMSASRRMKRAERVKKGTICMIGAFAVTFFAAVSIPDDIRRELNTLSTTEVLDRVSGKQDYHNRVALSLWKDHTFFGCGGWGYSHLSMSKLTPNEVKRLAVYGAANVHNDFLQFLAEHGAVGVGLMVVIVSLLVVPVATAWRKLFLDVRFAKTKVLPARPIALFVMPSPVFCILLTIIATTIHACGDCPLRSPAVLTLYLVSLAVLPGFIPRNVLPSR